MENAMSYANDLAKDRDKYLRQRNRLAGRLHDILDAHDAGRLTGLKHEAIEIQEARAELKKTVGTDMSVEKLLATR